MNLYLSVLLHIAIVLFSLACLSRLAGVLLSWFLSTLTKHKVEIGHVTLLSVHDIRIETRDSALKLSVKHVSIVSKLFSNSMRWVGLFVGGVDLQLADIGTLLLQRKQKTVTLTSTVDRKPLKIPSFVVYLIQRIHFRVESVTLHAKNRTLSLTVGLSTGVNLVSFPDKDNKLVSSHCAVDHVEIILKEDKTTYLNTSFGVKLDLLFSYYFQSIETMKVTVDMLSVMAYEGLLDVIKQFNLQYNSPSNSIETVTKKKVSVFKKISKLLPLVAKDRSFKIQNVSCSVSDVEETRNMSFKIESLSEEGAHDSTDTIIENLCLNNAKVYINNTDFLSIGSIKLSPLKVSGLGREEVTVNISAHIDMPGVQWFNTELVSWVTSIPVSTLPKDRAAAQVLDSTDTPNITITSVTRLTNLSVKMFEDSKSVRKLITLTVPSLDFHHSKSRDKFSVGVACKGVLLQLPVPLKIKKKLRDKLPNIQETHLWGQVLDFKSLTLKIQKYRETTKIDVDMQNSVLEWNFHFSNLIMELMPQFIIMLPVLASVKSGSSATPAKPRTLDIDCNIVKLNVFLLSNEPGEVCSLLYVNKLTVEKRGVCSHLGIENLYLHTMERLPEIYLCNIELEESDTLLYITNATMTRDSSGVSSDVSSVAVYWEPTAHRVLETCVNKTKGSIICIRDLLMYQRTSQTHSVSSPTQHSTQTHSSTSSSVPVNKITVNLVNTSLNFTTSPTNHISIEVTPLELKLNDSGVNVSVRDNVSIIMDGHRILCISEAVLEHLTKDKELLEVRECYPEFSSTNRAWLFSCREFKVFLPHNYGRDPHNSNHPTLALAIDEAQNCFKMLKALHRAPRLASDGEPLYADCRVDIKQFLVEFEDYEFDQKISRNYLIMQAAAQREIEASESVGNFERSGSETPEPENQQLNLSELADNSFTTSSSFWETYYDFQRFYKEGAESAPEEPVKLATLLITDVRLCVCADETLNGHDNVVEMINRLDDGTEVPHDLRFTTLWGRVISGTFSTFSLQLRNFSSELIHIDNGSIRGIICGAEAVSPNHAIRKTKVLLRKPWKNFELARGMNPLKYFYDLTLDTQAMEMSWGPCLEPSYQFFGQCLDKVTKKSRDPSPLLPFWDKCRNLMRGSFELRSQVFVMKALGEREPLKNSEYLSLCSNGFTFKWTNGQLTFDGDTVIKNNSESKYGECKIVTLPRMSLGVGMLWRTTNNLPNDHWDCVPYDPKFVKPQEEPWDSFKNFRSLNLDLDISVKFAKADTDSETDRYPKVNLYSHTLKWLDTWASVVIGTVSRPVFKGSLWKNLKPPKKKLTRHYRKIHFETDFDKAEVEIWSSYRKRAGAKITMQSGELSMTHKLALVPWPPIEQLDSEGNIQYVTLTRRPRAMWSTEKCSAHFHDIEGTLMGSLDSMSESAYDRDPNQRSPEHFLFSIDEVEYRQRGEMSLSTESLNSTNSRDSKLYTHWIVISDVKASINIDTRTLILAFIEQYENTRALKRDLSSEALKTISLEGEGTKKSPRGTLIFECSPNQSNDDLLSQFDEDQVTIVTSDDKSSSSKEKLAAEQACSDSDIKTRQWSIQMTNGQLAMQGPELNGFIMLTTGKCQVLGTEHWPVLRGGEFFSKFSWTCIVEHVQYFATVDEAPECSIPWLDESMITAKRSRYNSTQDPDAPESIMNDFEEQEESLKGIVREVYKLDTKQCATQLQRIVSRCGCLLSFVSFGSQPIEDSHSSTEDLQYTAENMYSSDLLSAFSLRHKGLEVATNTHQYKMIIDCVNNLLLRTEGSKRSSIGRLLHAFSLMRSGEDEARKTIAAYQKEVRESIARIKDMERHLYDLNVLGVPNPDRIDKTQRVLEAEKQKLNNKRVRLRLTISAFKEFKTKEGAIYKDQVEDQLMEVRKNEICIDDASWTLTGECGQVPIMEVNIQGGFAYSRTVYSTASSNEADQSPDFSSGHKFTLGHFCIRNLQNDLNPQNVLFPMSDGNDDGGNLNHRHCLRVYLSQQHNPVGGIIINHHLEINLVPLVLRFETTFWREIQKFFVGEDRKDDDGLPDYDDLDDSSSINPLAFEIRAQNSKRDKKFKFGSKRNVRTVSAEPHKALDEMSERSKKRFFNFVKIQQFPILISYKGKITVNEKTVLFPDIEIKERTQTWKELALEIKRISVPKVALSLGKLKQSYSAPIPVLSTLGVGSNSNVDESARTQEVYRFLTGSEADVPAKKKRGLSLSLRRNKPKKTAPPIPARPTQVPNDQFVKEVDNPGEWEDNTLGDRINVLKAMSAEPVTPTDIQTAPSISDENENVIQINPIAHDFSDQLG